MLPTVATPKDIVYWGYDMLQNLRFRQPTEIHSSDYSVNKIQNLAQRYFQVAGAEVNGYANIVVQFPMANATGSLQQ